MVYWVIVDAPQSSGEAELLAKSICQALLIKMVHNHFSNVYWGNQLSHCISQQRLIRKPDTLEIIAPERVPSITSEIR